MQVTMTTRENLMAILMANQGHWVSGEQVSNRLNISRAAVWKHMQRLQDEGYVIVATPKKGYKLQHVPDRLQGPEINAHLQTQTLGRPQLVCLAQTDSTNLRAKALAAQGAAEGTVVVADSQSHGRGRRGRIWLSPPGTGIYTSMILRPAITPAEAPRITLLTAVAAARALQHTSGIRARIKWPNDILIDAKKIAGILTEISTEMDAIDYIVVGLGLNVNTAAAQFDPEIRRLATSVRIETGHTCRRAELLAAYLNEFEVLYDCFQTKGFAPIMDQWRAMSDIIGRQVTVDVLGTRYRGTAVAVDDDGVLILEDEAGQTRRIFSGDVTRLRPKKPLTTAVKACSRSRPCRDKVTLAGGPEEPTASR